VVTLRLVELQRVHEAVQDAVGDAADAAAFQPGVVLDADPGQQRDLLPAQPADPTVRAVHRQARLLGGDLGAARGEELPEVVPARVVLGGHDLHRTDARGIWESLPVPLSTVPVAGHPGRVVWGG